MMEEKRLSKTLPEELVETIVSMMPFPAIFKARGISKSWLAKFSPVSRHKEEEKKQSAVAFQKLVREQSTKWSNFFPVYHDKDLFSFFEWQPQQWIRYPIPFFLRPIHPASKSFYRVLGIEGTLWYCAKRDFDLIYDNFYVGNIFTRIWKKLPARPILSDASINTDCHICTRLSPILVRDTSLDTYKLFVLFGYHDEYMLHRWCLQIYESTLDSWSTKKLVEGVARLRRGGEPIGSPVYFNGVIYACVPEFTNEHLNNVIYLTTFNIEKGSFEELALPMNLVIGGRGVRKVHLVVCCATLMMIVTYPYFTSPDAPCVLLHVLTVDVGSRQLLEVARAPPFTLDIRKAYGVCSGGKWIFFKGTGNPIATSIISYNVQEDEWASMGFPLPIAAADARYCQSAVFQPGLNPFAEV